MLSYINCYSVLIEYYIPVCMYLMCYFVISFFLDIACLAFLAMVLYLINLLGINIANKMLSQGFTGTLKDEVVTFLVGFFMILPYIVVNLVAILLVYLYAHAAYRQRQEQQKPTEDAPKEILMYWYAEESIHKTMWLKTQRSGAFLHPQSILILYLTKCYNKTNVLKWKTKFY